MRGKKFIHVLFCLCVAFLACGTALAQRGKLESGPYRGSIVPMAAEAPASPPFYSNLVVNNCTGCNYSTANGYLVLGVNNCVAPGVTQWLSVPFVAARSGAVKKVSLSVNDSGFCAATSAKFTVAIYDDSCTNTPGTQIGNDVAATAPAILCTLAQANFSHASVTLTAGQTYWLVVTTNNSPSQMGTTAVWWMSNLAQAPINSNDGNGWVASPEGAPGGFSVQ